VSAAAALESEGAARRAAGGSYNEQNHNPRFRVLRGKTRIQKSADRSYQSGKHIYMLASDFVTL
jgi:hypothetical protein